MDAAEKGTVMCAWFGAVRWMAAVTEFTIINVAYVRRLHGCPCWLWQEALLP